MAPSAENLGEGWQQQLEQLQSEASYFRSGGSKGAVPRKTWGAAQPAPPRAPQASHFGAANESCRGKATADSRLCSAAPVLKDPEAACRRGPSFRSRGLRPGVDEAALLQSTRCLQRSWRDLQQSRRLMLAKKQLAADLAVPVTSKEELPTEKDTTEQRPPESWSSSLPQEELWDEAIFYRQPSVDQVLEAQLRWCGAEEAAAVLSDQQSLEEMRKLEGRLNLRARGIAWRPPCAVGPCARGMLEAVLASASDPGGSIPHWLVPAASLLQLCLASSYMHWMELSRSYQHLDKLEGSLHAAPSGSYVEAVSPALHARCTLLRASLALRQRRYEAAEAAARDARQLLEARQSPRDFWPPHAWELAACQRICVVALCAMEGRSVARALGELQALWPLLASGTTASTMTKGMVARLKEEISVLQLEVEVANDVDQHCSERCGVASATLQALLRRAQALQALAGGGRARLELLCAKLVMLEELPWFVAGGARTEAVQQTHQWLIDAKETLVAWGHHSSQVLPAESICAALMEDSERALSLAQEWANQEALPEAQQLVSLLHQRLATTSTVPNGAMQVLSRSLAKVARPW